MLQDNFIHFFIVLFHHQYLLFLKAIFNPLNAEKQNELSRVQSAKLGPKCDDLHHTYTPTHSYLRPRNPLLCPQTALNFFMT